MRTKKKKRESSDKSVLSFFPANTWIWFNLSKPAGCYTKQVWHSLDCTFSPRFIYVFCMYVVQINEFWFTWRQLIRFYNGYENVYSAVRTGPLNKLRFVFKGLIVSRVLYLEIAVLLGYCASCHHGGRVIAFILVSRSLWNVDRYLRDEMASYHRIRQCWQTPSAEPEMLLSVVLLPLPLFRLFLF